MKGDLTMRKWLILAVVAWLGMGLGVATADVTVTATVDKTKDITVTETITKDKFVNLHPFTILVTDAGAESDALVNQANNANTVCSTDCVQTRSDSITNSVNTNSGVVVVNQAVGDMNNQGSAIATAIAQALPPFVGGVGSVADFAEAQAAADQRSNGNTVSDGNKSVITRNAFIQTSVNGNTGIALVNQSPGNMNNQSNTVSLSVSPTNVGVALSEADLGQQNSGNTVTEAVVTKFASISGSINTNTGIVGVNQSAGNMANQANVVSIAAAIAPIP
jgi:hypothetical protein